MNPQQMTQAPISTVPGQPIGYAPVYGATPPPLALATPGTPNAPGAISSTTGKRWIDGLILGGLVFGIGLSLTTWGVLDGLYSGKDIRVLENRANAAMVEAQAHEQRAANAEANAQQWQQHAVEQEGKLSKIREILGCK